MHSLRAMVPPRSLVQGLTLPTFGRLVTRTSGADTTPMPSSRSSVYRSSRGFRAKVATSSSSVVCLKHRAPYLTQLVHSGTSQLCMIPPMVEVDPSESFDPEIATVEDGETDAIPFPPSLNPDLHGTPVRR